MQSVSSKIWTRVAASISYGDNYYTTGTSRNGYNQICILSEYLKSHPLFKEFEILIVSVSFVGRSVGYFTVYQPLWVISFKRSNHTGGAVEYTACISVEG